MAYNPQTNCNIIVEPRSVLGSFGVVLEMSYKVNFHVSRFSFAEFNVSACI